MLHILRLESQREEAQTEQHQYSYTKSTNKLNPVKCAQISVMIWSRQKGHWNERTHRLRSHTSQKSNGAVIIDSKCFFGCTAPCLFSSIFKINAAANAPGAWINTSRRASLSFYFDLFRLFGAEPRHFALSSSSLLFFGCFKSIVPLFFSLSLSLFYFLFPRRFHPYTKRVPSAEILGNDRIALCKRLEFIPTVVPLCLVRTKKISANLLVQ